LRFLNQLTRPTRRAPQPLERSLATPDPARKHYNVKSEGSLRLESLPGSVLDHKYKIERQLGKGAMGAVFQAAHLGTTPTVAVKVIVPQLAASDEFSQRFKREAEAAGRLRHANVINVTDFGVTRHQDAELAYLVMEYLDGQTLSAYLKSEPRPSFNFIMD